MGNHYIRRLIINYTGKNIVLFKSDIFINLISNEQYRLMVKRILKHNFSLLNTDHVKLDNKWNYKNVISPYHRIYYIDEGNGQISGVDKALGLEAGFLYIIPSFTLCNMVCANYLSQYFVQFFEESPDGISIFSNSRSITKVKANEIDKKKFPTPGFDKSGKGNQQVGQPKGL